jgi:hypothetical protein
VILVIQVPVPNMPKSCDVPTSQLFVMFGIGTSQLFVIFGTNTLRLFVIFDTGALPSMTKSCDTCYSSACTKHAKEL